MTVSVQAEHTSAGPVSIRDEYCVLTCEEWVAVEGAMVWAMAVHKCEAEQRAVSHGDSSVFTASAWRHAAEAQLALAILRGTRDRTFDSHYPLVAS